MIRFTILGQPHSKANTRQLVKMGDRMVPIKSKEALRYVKDAQRQIPSTARQMLEGPVRMTLRMFYPSNLQDMDESLVLDVLQPVYSGKGKERTLVTKGVYLNDRQVRERHVYHFIDKANPRVEIEIEPMQPQQSELPVERHDDGDINNLFGRAA